MSSKRPGFAACMADVQLLNAYLAHLTPGRLRNQLEHMGAAALGSEEYDTTVSSSADERVVELNEIKKTLLASWENSPTIPFVLDVRAIDCGEEGSNVLIQLLNERFMRRLAYVDLSSNQLFEITKLMEGIAKLPALVFLSLHNISLDEDGVKGLAHALGSGSVPMLEYLDLSRCSISSNAGLIADALIKKSNLNSRIARYQQPENIEYISRFSIPDLPNFALHSLFKYVNLSYNNLGVDYENVGCIQLISVLLSRCTTLEVLDLSHNQFNTNTLLAILSYLPTSQSIKELRLAGNKIGPSSVEVMMEFVLQTPSLRILDLRDNSILSAGAITIARTLNNPRCNLSTVKLNDNLIGEPGLLALEAALSGNPPQSSPFSPDFNSTNTSSFLNSSNIVGISGIDQANVSDVGLTSTVNYEEEYVEPSWLKDDLPPLPGTNVRREFIEEDEDTPSREESSTDLQDSAGKHDTLGVIVDVSSASVDDLNASSITAAGSSVRAIKQLRGVTLDSREDSEHSVLTPLSEGGWRDHRGRTVIVGLLDENMKVFSDSRTS